jgi:hypothetical protein
MIFHLLRHQSKHHSLPSHLFSTIRDWFKPRYYEKSIQKEISDESLHTIIITHNCGPITVTGWKKNSIYLTSTHNAKDCAALTKIRTAAYKKDAHTLLLTTQGPTSGKWCVTHDLLIPQHMSVIVTTDTDSITLNDIQGTIIATATSGNIFINNCESTLKATTAKGYLAFHNTSGNITADTHAGKITFTYDTPLSTSTIRATTVEKNIVLTMPETINSSLFCSTEYGIINSEHCITLNPHTTKLNRKAWSFMKKNISGVIGAKNESSISLHSTYGNITILLSEGI